jgi:hypothetical protein
LACSIPALWAAFGHECDQRVPYGLLHGIPGRSVEDATYVKVRQNGRIVSVAVIVAVGVNSDGRREMLGMDIGPSEAETFGRRSCASSHAEACAA